MKGMKKMKGMKAIVLYVLYLSMFGSLLMNESVFATTETRASADQYVLDARQKVAEQDYTAAALLYQKALKLDNEHSIARHELKELLLESRRRDPEAEFSDVEWSLLEDSAKSRKLE